MEVVTGRELLVEFAKYLEGAPDEKRVEEYIDSFLEEFNPVNIPQPEQPKIKTTGGYDSSRLEFLKMQIGPVQNFYQTLGNILLSLSIRLDNVEEYILKAKIKQGLYEDYLKYTTEQGRLVKLDEFLDYIRTKEETVRRERSEAKADKS